MADRTREELIELWRAWKDAQDPYLALSWRLQAFVDGVVAGVRPADVVRSMKPGLKAPQCQASQWLAREDVRSAIAERKRLRALSVEGELAKIAEKLDTVLELLTGRPQP